MKLESVEMVTVLLKYADGNGSWEKSERDIDI
jgi:hypothetical protein